MSPTIDAADIAWRLLLCFIGSGIIGLNRGGQGRPAGLRTIILVSMTGCLGMVLAQTFMSSTGKAPDGFVNIDPMRLPLGVLSGIGFIGAGAILRRDTMVAGVTTAATLWYVTMVGLCFGAGQLILGGVAVVIAMVTLTGLKFIERHWLIETRRANLSIDVASDGPTQDQLRESLAASKMGIDSWSVAMRAEQPVSIGCQVEWQATAVDTAVPAAIEALMKTPGVIGIRWEPI